MPQEVGDFATLLNNGVPSRRALTWNLASGSTTIPGALLAYVGLQQFPQFNATILVLSAVSFLYIGLADLVVGLHQLIGAGTGLGQLFLILAGIGTICCSGCYSGRIMSYGSDPEGEIPRNVGESTNSTLFGAIARLETDRGATSKI